MNIKPRDVLTYLAIVNQGDWHRTYQACRNWKNSEVSDEEIEKVLKTLKCQYITILDDEYPFQLRNVHWPPLVLFYYGDISLIKNFNRNISVIGSRNNTEYGARMTHSIVKDICQDFNIVSGLAIGIDSIAHKAAIENGGRTIGVLGNGIDFIYLKSNEELYKEIREKHLVISEYPNDVPADENTFRMRNRIIAALSIALVVTEARNHSGSLITISFALQLGRDVFCVPYRADEGSHCNVLIKEGAFLAESGDDILYELKKIPPIIK